jgi:hypothetical protein
VEPVRQRVILRPGVAGTEGSAARETAFRIELSATLFDPSEGTTFTVYNNYPINISSVLGTNTVYVGFTASTGAGWENQDILNWTLANTASLPGSVPEPSNSLLLGTGLLALVFFACRLPMRPSPGNGHPPPWPCTTCAQH